MKTTKRNASIMKFKEDCIKNHKTYDPVHLKPIIRNGRVIVLPELTETFKPSDKAVGFGESVSGGLLIKKLIIPSWISEIFPCSFFRLLLLEEFHVEKGNKLYCDVDGVLFSKDKKTLISFPIGRLGDKYIIPEGTEVIGENAFMRCGVTEVVMPSTLKKIEPDAFLESSIYICNFLHTKYKRLGARCFKDCEGLYIARNEKLISEAVALRNWGSNCCVFVGPEKMDEVYENIFKKNY